MCCESSHGLWTASGKVAYLYCDGEIEWSVDEDDSNDDDLCLMTIER